MEKVPRKILQKSSAKSSKIYTTKSLTQFCRGARPKGQFCWDTRPRVCEFACMLVGDWDNGGIKAYRTLEGLEELASKIALGLSNPKLRIFSRISVDRGQFQGPLRIQNFQPPLYFRRFQPPHPSLQARGENRPRAGVGKVTKKWVLGSQNRTKGQNEVSGHFGAIFSFQFWAIFPNFPGVCQDLISPRQATLNPGALTPGRLGVVRKFT